MRIVGLGLCLFIACMLSPRGEAADAPRLVDPRLVLERIAAEPEIVTPTGIAVDHRGRILVIESHTHFPPEHYKGPRADLHPRLRRSGPRRASRTGRHLLRGHQVDHEPGGGARRDGLRREPGRNLPARRPRR